jgi:signal transduction histidine kinase
MLRHNPAMSSTPAPPFVVGKFDLAALGRWLVRQALIICGIALAVSASLVLVFKQSIAPTLLYSFCITGCCAFFVQLLRMGFARLLRRRGVRAGTDHSDHWPGWPLMLLSLLLGTALGYSVGVELGNWFTGYQEVGLHNASLRKGLTIMLISLIPGLGLTFHFVSKGRLAAAEARAQTAQRQAAEHQLRLLEAQLEPHMLFNTLANLRVLIGLDAQRAQAMLDQLIAFLRATLNASRRNSHPLRDEFARLADYLALMQVRMGGRLRTELILPPELAALPVPPLLLQPLVENAIKHGLEPHVEGGELIVSATREQGQLLLRVRDTGAGLSATPQPSNGFGLEQVRTRLATQYGEAASLSLSAVRDERGGGTLVCLRLPLTDDTLSSAS